MHLDESDFNNFWEFIQKHQLFSVIDSEARNKGMRTTAYINNQLGNSKPNNVKYIYYSWVNQGRPPSHAMSRASVTPVIHLHSLSIGHGITKRKKRRKPRKKKSVKKRKGKSKKKRVHRKRKSRRRS